MKATSLLIPEAVHDESSNGVCVLIDDLVVEVSPQFCLTIGYSREEIVGTNLCNLNLAASVCHPDSSIHVQGQFRLALATHPQPKVYEVSLQTKDGSSLYLLGYEIILNHGCSKKLQIIVAHDQSKTLTESAIKDYQLEFMASMQNETVGALEIDQEGQIANLDEGASYILGQKSNKLIGSPISSFFEPRYSRYLKRQLKKLKGSQRMQEVLRTSIIIPDGRSIPCLIYTIKCPSNEEAKPTALSIIIETDHKSKDIRAMNYALLHEKEQIQNQLGMELHDGLGQKLIALKIQVNHLLNLQSNNQTALNKLAEIADEAIRECRTISHHLTSPAFDTAPLYKLMQSLQLSMFNPGATEVALKINDAVEHLPTLIKQQVYRISQELFANCVKHAHASEVYLQLDFDEEYLVLNYHDNGAGFDLGRAKRGIGLINISLRVKALEGKLDYDTAPGNGTSVNIQIPIHLNTKHSVSG